MAPPLTHTLAGIDIPRRLVWTDEFQWSAMERAQEMGLTGKLILDVAPRQGGRPITLASADDHGWLSRTQVLALQALADASDAPMPLQLADGRTFSVVFAPGNPVQADPIARAELPPDNLPYVVTLSLVTV